MELINKKDAIHAVLHYTGDAAVAAVQNIKPVINTDEIDRKDKAIERMRYLMRHYKNAYRTAYKMYQEARNGN